METYNKIKQFLRIVVLSVWAVAVITIVVAGWNHTDETTGMVDTLYHGAYTVSWWIFGFVSTLVSANWLLKGDWDEKCTKKCKCDKNE